MYDNITGAVTRVTDSYISLYNASQDVAYRLVPVGRHDVSDYVCVWVHYAFNERTGTTLYGFKSAADRDLFENIIRVRGVASAMARAIFDVLTCEQFTDAINAADVKTLTSVKGVGKKVAELLISTLSGKLAVVDSYDPDILAVVSALETVGCSASKALVLAISSTGDSISSRVRSALANM